MGLFDKLFKKDDPKPIVKTEHINIAEKTKEEAKATPTPQPPQPKTIHEEKHTYVAGLEYHAKEFKALVRAAIEADGDENDDYTMAKKELLEEFYEGDRIWQYEPIELAFKFEDEPDNPNDPNAMKVWAKSETGDDEYVFIGYVPKTKTRTIRKSVANNEPIRLYLKGGKYKEIGDETVYTEEIDYSLDLEYHVKKTISA